MSVDALFNTSWQVLIGVAVLWWTMFAALRLHLRTSSASTLRDKLESIARPLARSSSPTAMIDRWYASIANVGVTFELVPDPETKLVAVKWFLGGLLVTGLVILLAQIIMFGSEMPTPGEIHAIRLLSLGCLIISAVIFAAILVAALFCDGARAIKHLALPGDLRSF